MQAVTHLQQVATQTVGAAQQLDTDTIAIGNGGQRVATADFMRARLHRQNRARRRVFAKVAFGAIKNGLRQFLLITLGLELTLFAGVRDEGRLDENGRDVRRLEDPEARLFRPTQLYTGVYSADPAPSGSSSDKEID